MNILKVYFVLLIVSSSYADPVDQTERNYYRAAVYEHARFWNLSANSLPEIIQKNLNMYEIAAEVAASKAADIIIFPEYGILPPATREELKGSSEQTPDPRLVTTNPCEQKEEFSTRPILYTLSCMAKKHNIVVVANTVDIQPCVPENNRSCPDDGVYLFNTLVAFSRDGSFISRYYKTRLFFEFPMDLPYEFQNSTFETDFGTFAMFICYDIVFDNITKAAAKEVDNIILSANWLDDLPNFGLPYWQGWALGNNVTLLTPNIHVPGYLAVGSGIFSGHFGAIKYTFNPDGLSKLIVSRVPKSKDERGPFPNPDSSITVITENGTEEYNEEEDGKDVPQECSFKILGAPVNVQKDYRCTEHNLVNYTLVKLTKLSDNLEACSNGMCCSLSYSASSLNESYFFGVFNGTYSIVDRYFYSLENCMVVRCDAFNGSECVTFPLRSNTVFERFEIKANFTTEFVYPGVVKSSMRLAPMGEWSHGLEKEGDSMNGHLKFQSLSEEPLLFAGLYGRCYDRDPPYIR